MGTFADYIGEMDIPENQRAEYAQRMLKLLHASGMMSVDEVGLFGHRIRLLYPPELDETGRAWGCYNYFENDFWESWGLNADKGTFSSTKLGGGAFCTAILAGYVLTALHSRSYGIVTVDGSYVCERRLIGWINGVLGTQYTNQRATQLWEIEKLLHKDDCGEYNKDLTGLIHDVPTACADPEQVEWYNTAYSDSAGMLPADYYEIPDPEAVIPAGETASSEVEIRFRNLLSLDKTQVYVLPVSIDGADVATLASRRTVYFVVKEASLVNVVANLRENAVSVEWRNPDPLRNLRMLFSSIGNGGTSASDRTRRDFTRSSISPVARFLLTAPPLSSTTPVTAITNSLLSLPAFAKPSSSMLPFSKINCMIPERSLKSTKIIPPLSRAF